jgi:hypothetical protein
MEAVASLNTRVKDPLYHLVISWSDGESPDQAEAFESVTYTLKQLGFEGHQFVAAIHRDTDNVHVHVMVNRVHPDSLTAVSPANDYYVMDRAMRELEIRYGRAHAPGPYVVVERNGQKVVERARVDPDKPRRQRRPQGAERMETFAGEESLHTYARGEPRKMVVQLLKEPALTWTRLHSELAKFGLELRPKGSGLGVFALDAPDVTPIKASNLHENLSLTRLERKLGPYEEPVAPSVSAAPKPSEAQGAPQPDDRPNYTKHRESDPIFDRQPRSKRDPVQREARKQARAEARRNLKLRYTQYCNAFVVRKITPQEVKARHEVLAKTYREQRTDIRRSGQPTAKRKAAYSLLAAKAARDRRTLQLAIEKERAALKSDPTNQRLSFRDWVFRQAEQGDEAALAQLRGWHYAEQRKAGDANAHEHPEANEPGMAPARPTDAAEEPFSFDKVRPKRVLRNGAVLYWQDGDASFIDYGRIVRMAHKHENRDEHILAALVFSRQKFGAAFKLTGSDEFKARAIALIAKQKLDVRLTEPKQQADLDAMKSGHTPRGPRL